MLFGRDGVVIDMSTSVSGIFFSYARKAWGIYCYWMLVVKYSHLTPLRVKILDFSVVEQWQGPTFSKV